MEAPASAHLTSLQTRARSFAALGDASRLAIVEALALGDLRPAELGRRLGLRSNLLAFHIDVLESAGLLRRKPSAGDGRQRYLQLEIEALAGIWHWPKLQVRRVLFVCHHNAARSQLAEASWRSRSRLPVASAGMAPARAVHPEARRAARAVGLDLSSARPRGYADLSEIPDLVVSVCDLTLEQGPPFAQSIRLHWSIPDPVADGRPAAFDEACRAISRRVEHLLAAIEPGPSTNA